MSGITRHCRPRLVGVRGRIPRRPAGLTVACLLGSILVAPPDAAASSDSALNRGEAAWSRRAENHRGDSADPRPIAEAIAAYEEALATAPHDLLARWRLMRALFFQGDYTGLEREAKLAVFERGRRLGEEGLDQLAEAVGGREELDRLAPADLARRLADEPHAAAIYFWTAAHWGLWGRHRGKVAAARQGVAGRIRDYAERVIALDELYDSAAGHRILGRLHTEAPRIPFVTGWVDRKAAIAHLERAVTLGPDEPYNRLYLIEVLLEVRRRERDQALADLRTLAARTPREAYRVEDNRLLEEARQLLERFDRD